MIANILAIVAFTVAGAAGFWWFRRMLAVRLPRDRTGFLATMGAAFVLGTLALILGADTGAKVLAVLAATTGAIFLLLNTLSGQEDREPGVQVGGPVIDFTVPVGDGRNFELGSLRGKPFLLKFFRGHW